MIPIRRMPSAAIGPLSSGSSGRGDPVVELCIHAANVFYLASFLGRDMLWLRA